MHSISPNISPNVDKKIGHGSPPRFDLEKVETAFAIKFAQVNEKLLNFNPRTIISTMQISKPTDRPSYIVQQVQNEINLQKRELQQELMTLTSSIKDSNNETHKRCIKLLSDTLADCHKQLDQHKPHLIKTITEAFEASKQKPLSSLPNDAHSNIMSTILTRLGLR